MKSIMNDLKISFVQKHGDEEYDTLTSLVECEFQIMECIIARRQYLNLKQSDLAKAIGTTQAQISRYESMERSPTLLVLLKILMALDLNINLVDSQGKALTSKWKV